MLQKVEAITKVANSGVVAVVRGQSKEESLKTAIACIEGGISGIELAFTAPHADTKPLPSLTQGILRTRHLWVRGQF